MILLRQVDNLCFLVVRVLENTEIINFMVIALDNSVLLCGPCHASDG